MPGAGMTGQRAAMISWCRSSRPGISSRPARPIPHSVQIPQAGPPRVTIQQQTDGDTTLQFPNSDVKDVLRFYESLTGKKLIMDNFVSGKVDIFLSMKVPRDEAIKIIEMSLLLNGYSLIPAGDDPLPMGTHLQLLDGLAGLSARMWGLQDTIGLLPVANRWLFFGDADIEAERRLGWPNPVPKIASEGWLRFSERAPDDVRSLVRDLRADSRPLVDAVSTTPLTFLHSDWKLGNLGVHRDGRVVLLDWTYCGEGPVCYDLGWYLALNAARLPHPKEDAISALRSALEAKGIATRGWWERQQSLCLLGTLVNFGWEKALGTDDELGWWCDRAREGARQL